MPGQHRLDAFEARHWSRQREKCENVIDAAQVGPGLDHPGSEQGLDLGRKQQPVALPCPEEWADAETVAAENDPLPAFVPEREGELAAQPLEHLLFVFFPQVWDDFRIAMRGEAMAARFQFSLQLRI